MERFDTYDYLLEALGYGSERYALPEEELDNKLDSITSLAREIGIDFCDTGSKLIIWNDDVNDMIHVVLALYEICQLDNEESMKVMMDAHENGMSIARIGAMNELMPMNLKLKKRNINSSIQ